GGGVPSVARAPAPDPAAALAGLVAPYRAAAVPPSSLPRFWGGAVGYLGYDSVRAWEPIPSRAQDDLGLPEAVFVLTDTLLTFDNLRQTVKVVATALVDERDPGAAWDAACARIDALVSALEGPRPPLPPLDLAAAAAAPLASRTRPDAFLDGVRRIKEHILA